MSLLDEVEAAVRECGNVHPDEYLYDIEDAKIVHTEYSDSLRWANELVAVINRGDEYVRVIVLEPSTEMQEWDQYDATDVEVVAVVPKEVTTVRYVEVWPMT